MKHVVILICFLALFSCKKRCGENTNGREIGVEYVAPYDAKIDMQCGFDTFNIKLYVNGKCVMTVNTHDTDFYEVVKGDTYIVKSNDPGGVYSSIVMEYEICK